MEVRRRDPTSGRFISVRACLNCERCTWNLGPDCGIKDHPHCEKCGHCIGRHTLVKPCDTLDVNGE